MTTWTGASTLLFYRRRLQGSPVELLPSAAWDVSCSYQDVEFEPNLLTFTVSAQARREQLWLQHATPPHPACSAVRSSLCAYHSVRTSASNMGPNRSSKFEGPTGAPVLHTRPL